MSLTLAVAPRRMVEGEAQGDDGGDLQDDESEVLQGFPHQLQEGLGLLGRYEVLSECRVSLLQVHWVSRETYEQKSKHLDTTRLVLGLYKHHSG